MRLAVEESRPKLKRPPLYRVVLINDDYTPMEFVVHVLERFFGLSHAQAFEIMLTVHKKGVAVVGVFSHEVAETKVSQVMDFVTGRSLPEKGQTRVSHRTLKGDGTEVWSRVTGFGAP